MATERLEFPPEDFSRKSVQELIRLLTHSSFEMRQGVQKELLTRGKNVVIELRQALSDCSDTELAHRLQSLIEKIHSDMIAREQTQRLVKEKDRLENQSRTLYNTLAMWDQKLCQLTPSHEDCQTFIANWDNIQNYLFWVRERLNEVEIRKAAYYNSQKHQ